MTERPLKPSHAEIYNLLMDLLERVGEVNEDGVTGTGLTGRIMRTEAKVLAYDMLKQRVYGALAGLAVASAIIWWLIKDKLAATFGVSVG